jgi:hypothetical protein
MSRDRSSVRKGVAAVFAGTGQIPENIEAVINSVGASNGEEFMQPGGAARVASNNGAGEAWEAKSQTKTKKRSGQAPDGKVKVTWYIDESLVAKMKHLAVDFRRRDSDLVAEGIQEILKKYEKN